MGATAAASGLASSTQELPDPPWAIGTLLGKNSSLPKPPARNRAVKSIPSSRPSIPEQWGRRSSSSRGTLNPTSASSAEMRFSDKPARGSRERARFSSTSSAAAAAWVTSTAFMP
jgi:hypothetical protein